VKPIITVTQSNGITPKIDMPKYPFDKCYIITSESELPESSIVNILALKYEVHTTRNADELNDVSGYDHIIQLPSSMTRSEMSSLMAHVEVWQKLADQDFESALILEDTAVTNFDPSSLNTKLLEFYSAHGDNFDILYLGKCQDSCGRYKKVYNGLFESKHPLCKYAYIITKECIQKLLAKLPTPLATDHFLTKCIESESLQSYVFHPNIIKRNDLVLFEDDDEPSKSKAWKEEIFRETVECKYESETDELNWIPFAIVGAVILLAIIILLSSKRSTR